MTDDQRNDWQPYTEDDIFARARPTRRVASDSKWPSGLCAKHGWNIIACSRLVFRPAPRFSL